MKGFTIKASYIKVIGFEIKTSTDSSTDGLGVFLQGQYIEVLNNYIHDVPREGIWFNNPNGDSNNIVQGNRIYRAGSAGIRVHGRNSLIEDNDISRILRFSPNAAP